MENDGAEHQTRILRASAPAHVCVHTLPHTQADKPLTIKEVADQFRISKNYSYILN